MTGSAAKLRRDVAEARQPIHAAFMSLVQVSRAFPGVPASQWAIQNMEPKYQGDHGGTH